MIEIYKIKIIEKILFMLIFYMFINTKFFKLEQMVLISLYALGSLCIYFMEQEIKNKMIETLFK